MNLIDRKLSVVTQKETVEDLREFEKFPIYMGCTDEPESNDLSVDMRWGICRESGVIQLTKLIPLDILYKNSHGSGLVGKIWAQHHHEFAKFIFKQNPRGVLEIGGGHGILATEYLKIKELPWTIIEPNPSPIENCKATFVKSFFDTTTVIPENIDTVVNSHVLEHIYEPRKFIELISSRLKSGSRFIFSVPNMRKMLERSYTNTLNFEHTTFLTEGTIEYLLKIAGFQITEKQYYLDDHSIFYAATKHNNSHSTVTVRNEYSINKSLFNSFVNKMETEILKINTNIENKKEPIFLFGAHIFSQYLLALGLKSEKIEAVLDNDPSKLGKRLYGSSLMVKNPTELKLYKDPIIILKAGIYNKEIKKQIIESCNQSAIFIE